MAGEHTYQLLHQVSGRAGREGDRGVVMIQSYNPNSRLLKAICNLDYMGFCTEELHIRSQANMPPFGKLANIILSGTDQEKLHIFAQKLVAIAPKASNLDIYGPAPACIVRAHQSYWYHILLRSNRNFPLQKYITYWFSLHKKPSKINITIDIDPMRLF